ncbi:MAG: dihydrodipicolinate reductase, partial [Dehalococcoidia bacterium]
MPIPVIVQGLGPIGLKILQAAHADPGFTVVGAVDIAESIVGRAASALVDGGPANITVRSSLADARSAAGEDDVVVLQATGSYLQGVAPQLED